MILFQRHWIQKTNIFVFKKTSLDAPLHAHPKTKTNYVKHTYLGLKHPKSISFKFENEINETDDWLQDIFAAIQKERIKAMRQFADSCKYVSEKRFNKE